MPHWTNETWKRSHPRRDATFLSFFFLAACTTSPPAAQPPAADTVPATTSLESSRAPSLPSADASLASPVEPILLVTEPGVLALLEKNGYALGDFVGGPGTGAVDNARLASAARYASVADAIAADIDVVRRRDSHAGVGVHRFPHRLFDVRWLRAKTARFELVAVANRLDRAPFHAESCGETRLVYRLAYSTKVKDTSVTSRLPATLGLEVPVPAPASGCGEVARRWLPERALEGAALAEWLGRAEGPLARALVSFRDAKLVANVQQVRWPSAVRPDLAGHAEYLLRSFRLDASGESYEAAPLENTPDGARLASDTALRKDFLAWLAEPEHLAGVDRGTAVVPERFLAKRSISVTPRGLSRSANRPFARLFSVADFAALDFRGHPTVRSAKGLLRRLDELTCPGCHEARSIAGFHLLGDDPEATPAANALATGISPHLHDDLERRRLLIRAVLDGATADFSQPFPERGEDDGYGAHCGLGAEPTFAAWTCAAGLVCQPYDAPLDDGVGQCLPPEPRAAGDPCEVGPLDAKRDRVTNAARTACSESAACNTNAVGFPGGMCTETCSALSPNAVCGSIAVLDPFNACVARGEPFLDCLANNVRPAGFRACDADEPCRDDYICTRTKAGQKGACIPPYFLFQLRVDGHP